MVDYDFLKAQFNIEPEDVPKLQELLLTSIKNKSFDEINKKCHKDAIIHLANDLVFHGKLVSIAHFSSSAMEFSYGLPGNNV